MKILFITATYLPTINGVSYQINILKKALEKKGHVVFILAPSFPGFSDREKNIIRFPSIPNPLVKQYPIGIPLVPIKRIKKINPDVVHTHHPFIFGQFGKTISEKLSIPLFFTAHTQYGQYLDYYLPIGKEFTSKLLTKNLKDLSKKCFKVICPSKQSQEKMNSLGIKNTIIINNSIEDDFFRKPSKKNLLQPTIVFTGRLEKEKNLFFLIKICKELKKLMPNFRMLIIGYGSLMDSLHNKIRKYQLEANVLLTGEVNRQLLPDIYKGSHLFLTTSISEVMPLTIIESLSNGVPIIALEKSGLEEIVINGKTGYLIKANQRLIAEKISELFSKPKLLKKLSENAYKHAVNFSVSNKVSELEKIYTSSK
ncbi:hypothetical protein A2159_02710 [Candidatus Woesebacteria bacterium RBG_13_34_9]|uniref:Glycosyl transferase family 1 domain-containing protein n=1 Tax=Candidatus Woesebacteria bacterium RBG_13_34_9 TaxID=1802477 RepID=A0A1F7X0S0_9BACT|nr:MAG: hypothetical protein A2159_02710 [Candidatus Woesebacteria bacterium RBG_13_34_9]